MKSASKTQDLWYSELVLRAGLDARGRGGRAPAGRDAGVPRGDARGAAHAARALRARPPRAGLPGQSPPGRAARCSAILHTT